MTKHEEGRAAVALPAAPNVTLARARTELLFGSFTVLFQELAFIRALPGQVRVLGYFPNLILISAFLGLGIGALRADRRSLLWLWPPSVLLLVIVSGLMSRVAFTANNVSEHLWLLYFDLPPDSMVFDGVRLPIVVLFVLSAVTFVPLGQLIAHRLNVFRRESGVLWGYSLDLTGSLLGVIAFSVFAFLGTGPTFWHAAIAIGAAPLFLPRPRLRWAFAVACIGMLVIVNATDRAERYSPYYAIATNTRAPYDTVGGFEVLTNGSLHQIAWPMGRADPPVDGLHQRHQIGLRLPLQYLQDQPRRALVLGAGTGNDVAVLLDHGIEQIDAVEIDPEILEIGRERHPDRPYDSPRVRVFTTDARSFLNDTENEYDLIVFGTLDSMTRLSALSAVRLDNFVYTRQAIAAARRRLAPGGGMALSFWVEYEYIHDHLRTLLGNEFGEPPAVISGNYRMLNTVYLAGPAYDHLGPELRAPPSETAVEPTDDWPYLYLPRPGIGSIYLSLIAILIGLAIVGVIASSSEIREGLRSRRGADVEMFLYGFAFLLMETRYVTEMNLLWGASWLTSAVVFGAILAVILAGTIAMQVRPMSFRWAFGALIACILVTYFIPVDALLSQSRPLRLALSIAYVGGPVVFASICFALRFIERTAPDLAFGWNLLGAVVGGLTELLSMVFGLKALLLAALGAYLASVYARRWTPRVVDGPGAATDMVGVARESSG